MRDVTLKQLRSLAATLEQGTIAGAAQVLHVTPPAVSQQLRLLERSAGLPLMERTADGFRPTDAGRELAEATARIEAEVARCSRTLEAIASGSGGRVVFGAVSTAKYVAPQILASFWTQHPDIEVRLEDREPRGDHRPPRARRRRPGDDGTAPGRAGPRDRGDR